MMANHIAQSVMCLTADICLTADPGVASSILTRSHTFVEIDHEIISTAILLPSTNSSRVVVSYKQKSGWVVTWFLLGYTVRKNGGLLSTPMF